MNWKLKSAIQRTCAVLPLGGDQAAYYAIQRLLGRLKGSWDSSFLLSEAARLSSTLTAQGHPVLGAVCMEVGTGRGLDMPVGFYLCGAKEVHTWDLYRLLKEHVVVNLLDSIRANESKVREVFLGAVPSEVLDERMKVLTQVRTLDELFSKTGIRYHAPADASKTGLPAASVDIQTSYTVFEHIPGEVLTAILREAARILRPEGAALHHIDLSDHFAHADASIPFINFLRFTEKEWKRYASNSFAYHNRLQAPAYREIYAAAGHEIVGWDEIINQRSLRELKTGFPLAEPYRGIPPETLAVSVLQVLSRGPAARESNRPHDGQG
jgi:SAM-dependent methyltransferase